MPVTVAKGDVSQAGWQRLRAGIAEMEKCGVGKALEAYKGLYAKGSDAIFAAGTASWNDALKKGVEVNKALATAKKKALAIKDPARKKKALEVVDGFEKVVAKFADEILSKEDKQKKAAAVISMRTKFRDGLTIEHVIGDAGLHKAFLAFAAGEHSLSEVSAAIGWKAKKYKETTLKYAENNEWNQEAGATKEVLGHFKGTKVLPPAQLDKLIDKLNHGFVEMALDSTGSSSFGRFLKSKALDAYIATRFPGA